MNKDLTPKIKSKVSHCLIGPSLSALRSVDNYEKLNRIEEGSYGIVYRAKDKDTNDIVALKKLKLENEKDGFPITSLREIHTLKLIDHPNVVKVLEIVATSSLNQYPGQIKVADFGLARRYGSPLGNMTQLVVTLWYRAPELLLGVTNYTTAVDMWSIGCIFGELLNNTPLLCGKGEIDQLTKIFQFLGTPTDRIWPGFSSLPNSKTLKFAMHPIKDLKEKFPHLSPNGIDLMKQLLIYDPEERISAAEALQHPFFTENPLPKDPDLFPSFPSKSAGEKRKRAPTPNLGEERKERSYYGY
ncbi:hypothetical protein HDV02_002670 [Globomyces sp. JEL0801]|nr:hypothetical protein HDV02_002670 [Globomyces sp. JEL0801]